MSDQQLMHLFHRAGDTMEPDVVALVAAGAARGRLGRRRRAAGALLGLATAAVVGAAAIAGLLVPEGDDGATGAAPARETREVAVAPADMGATLASLLPGARPVKDHEPYQYQVQRGVVEWHGVEVIVSIDSRSVGTTTTAREQCEAFLDQACTEAPGGGWLAEHGSITPAGRGRPETYFHAVRLYDPDGYMLEALGEAGPAEAVDKGLESDADPALLRRLVLEDVWLH